MEARTLPHNIVKTHLIRKNTARDRPYIPNKKSKHMH